MTGTRRLAVAVLGASLASLASGHPVQQGAQPVEVDSAMIIPQAVRDSESARLRALGAQLPPEGLILERPWDPPFTRRSFVVPQSWFRRRRTDSVSADALAKDLPVLHAVMERAYGGWANAERRGWKWDEWFADWTAMLAKHAGDRLDVVTAFAPMKQFMAFQLDNHTTIPLGRSFGTGSASSVIGGTPTAPCTEIKVEGGAQLPLDLGDPAQRPRRAMHWSASRNLFEPVTYLSYPAGRGAPTSIRCGGDWLPMIPAWQAGDVVNGSPADAAARANAIRTLSGDQVDEPDFKLLAPDVAYLRLPTFDEKNNQLIRQRVSSWPTPTGRESVIIVDLRDNDGGTAMMMPLAKWVDVKRVGRADNTNRHEGASCLYHALRYGYFTVSTSGLKPPFPQAMSQRVQGIVDDLLQQSPEGCPSEFKDSNSDWDYRQHHMLPPGRVGGRIRIMALVNNGCGSDCEGMLMELASLEETVIVGTNTFGVAEYIQPGYSVLPHTRLPFRIALGTSDGYGDRRSFDGYGFDVDVLLSTEADSDPRNLVALARYVGGR